MDFSSQRKQDCHRVFPLIVLSILLSITAAALGAIAGYDFNDDGKVDVLDVCVLAGSWLGNNPVTDIYPSPSGDGIVNLNDFAQFAKSWPATESLTNSPYEQFAKESESVVSVLTSMQEAVNNNQGDQV